MSKYELKHYGVLGMKWGVRRYQNKDGTLTKAGKKRDRKEVDKQIAKRNTDLFVKSNNYAAERINGEWLEGFNKKWSKAFEGYDNWQDSPNYKKYENAYIKNLSTLMNQSLSNDPNAKITTKLGSTYTARYLEEHGNLVWSTPKEWGEYDKQKSSQQKTRSSASEYSKNATNKEKRILSEIRAYEKKTGRKGLADNFVKNYDDFELWDIAKKEGNLNELFYWDQKKGK